MLVREELRDDGDRRESEELCCPVIELRHYTLKPGRRDELIELFEEHFIEGQEQYGMRVIGQFRQRSQLDSFIWLRGFSDMDQRRHALEGFYYGPIWKQYRSAANDTMLDSDDVLLLRPAHATTGFRLRPADRPAPDVPEPRNIAASMIIATIYSFASPLDAHFVEFFTSDIAPVLQAAGATLLAQFVTEPSENTFPVLPVRKGEHVFAWFASFADNVAYETYQAALARDQSWHTELVPMLHRWLAKPEEVLELLPSRRSLLRHSVVRPDMHSA